MTAWYFHSVDKFKYFFIGIFIKCMYMLLFVITSTSVFAYQIFMHDLTYILMYVYLKTNMKIMKYYICNAL